jgi:hypothetical protein
VDLCHVRAAAGAPGGTNQGRLALSVVAIGLPLLVMAARALVLRRTRTAEAWRGGWGAGVVLVALLAFEPSMIIPVLLFAVLGAVMLRRAPRKIGRIGIRTRGTADRLVALGFRVSSLLRGGCSSGLIRHWTRIDGTAGVAAAARA